MDEMARSPEAGILAGLARWGKYEIGQTYSPATAAFTGRVVEDIARERGENPQDTLFEIVIADELRTDLWPIPSDDEPESWKLRTEVWRDDRALIGGSDAGAHLDRMCGGRYTTAFLGDVVRDRGLFPLEEAIRLMTDAPARFFGLRERGRIAPGWHADLVIFDPARVGATAIRSRRDLPGGTDRLFSAAEGVHHVFVNGREIVRDGKETGNLPGTVLRSGRDVDTVEVPG
jgi:N-acyl-D-aspartate/D-glutamate deacylase